MIKGITQSLDSFHSGEYQIVKCLLRTMLLFFVSSQHIYVFVRQLWNSFQKALYSFWLFFFSIETTFFVQYLFFYFLYIKILKANQVHGITYENGFDMLIVRASSVKRRFHINLEQPRPKFSIKHYIEAEYAKAFTLLSALHLRCNL